MVVTSVGYLVSTKGNSLIVCPHVSDDDDIDGEIIIPKTWVLSVTSLVTGKPLKVKRR